MNKPQTPDWVKQFFRFETEMPVNKLAFSDKDMEYKCKIIQKMQDLGMHISIDRIGNICGTLQGKTDKTLALVSHTDSVFDGGQFDGSAGIIASLMAVEKLKEKPNNTIKVIICACEESSVFNQAYIGSKYLSGTLGVKDFDKISGSYDKKHGYGSAFTLAQAVHNALGKNGKGGYLGHYTKKFGLKNIEYVEHLLAPGEKFDHALELHIEQFQSLSDSQTDIGIVRSIVGPFRFKLRVKGFAGHSGATPMDQRKDASFASSLFHIKLEQLARKQGSFRATSVQTQQPSKTSMNTIIDEEIRTFDLRMQMPENADKIAKRIEDIILEVEKETGTALEVYDAMVEYENMKGVTKNNPKEKPPLVHEGLFKIHPKSVSNPVETDENLRKEIFSAAQNLGLTAVGMDSWAGHDITQVPASQRAMFFIASTGGSHNPTEKTTPQALAGGAAVLTELMEKI